MNGLQHTKGRVLLVDAEPSEAEQYRRSLAEAGFHVAEARNGASALKKVAAEHFDVVLMNITVPDITGPDLLRSLRARSRQIPLILMVDAAEKDLDLPGLGDPALRRLIKPINPKTLERAVASAVRLHHGGSLAAYRNRRGERVEPSMFSATNAKNEFGRVLDTVIQGGLVVVTKHDAQKAVIMSVEDFNALSTGASRELDTLASDFDALLDRMQTPEAGAGMKTAFGASPEELGKAAVAAARKRA